MRGMKVLTLLCMLLLPVSIHAEDTALLIGIGDYIVAGNLPGIDKDVDMIRRMI